MSHAINRLTVLDDIDALTLAASQVGNVHDLLTAASHLIGDPMKVKLVAGLIQQARYWADLAINELDILTERAEDALEAGRGTE